MTAAALSALAAAVQAGLQPLADALTYRATTLFAAKASGAVAAGATSITLGTLPAGMSGVQQGDTFGAGVYAFTETVAASGGTITAAFTPALSLPLASGANVSVVRNTDIGCSGWCEWLDLSSVLAPSVQQGDVRVTIFADTLKAENGDPVLGESGSPLLAFVPRKGDKIVSDEKIVTIESVGRDPAGAAWVLQAKG